MLPDLNCLRRAELSGTIVDPSCRIVLSCDAANCRALLESDAPPLCAVLARALVLRAAHSDPTGGFLPDERTTPFAGGAPLRLTYDDGIDGFASYSPDGALLLYSFQPRDRADRDRCIGIMPAGGGSREEHCDNSGPGAARTDALEYPAVNSRGDLLYARYASAIGDLIPNTAEISLEMATRERPLRSRTILQLPTIIDGVGMTRIGTIRWQDDQTFVFVAEEMTLVRNPITQSFRDTVVVGAGLIRGSITATGVQFRTVGGVVDANGFDFSAGRDSIFFTRTRDNRLYAVAAGSTVATVVYTTPQTFSAPRDLRHPVRIGRHVAAVSQDIEDSEPPLFPAGLTPGAKLELIETASGASTLVQEASQAVPSFGRLAAAPAGCRLTVEFRHRRQVSFTTDLYTLCPGQVTSCAC